jgi:hypothetical protein
MRIAGAGLIPGAGSITGIGSSLGVNSTLTSAISSFTSLPVVSQFSNIVTQATGTLSGGVLDSLRTMGQDFTALTNAIPSSFTSALSAIAPGGVANGGLTGLITQTAQGIMGGPLQDLTQFGQIYNSAAGYIGQANQFINSNLNIGSIAGTFGSLTGGMDNLITGSFSQVSEAFGAFGSDLTNLGSLIDMGNLANLGSPSALVGQLATVGGLVPSIERALSDIGITPLQLTNLASGSFTNISDSANKLLYDALGNITGSELTQIKSILGVTTPNIATAADLLNLTKILPTSFASLTMPTPDGLRGIYATIDGAVNTNIERWLIDPNAPAYTGDDEIVLARLGLSSVNSGPTTLI